MKPYFPFKIYKRQKLAIENNIILTYDDIDFKRKYFKLYLLGSLLLGVFMVHTVKYSGAWYFAPFLIPTFIAQTDRRYRPFGEIESFYKYVEQKRKAEAYYRINQSVNTELKEFNKNGFQTLKTDLENSNKTVYDVVADLDEMYLKNACKL